MRRSLKQKELRLMFFRRYQGRLVHIRQWYAQGLAFCGVTSAYRPRWASRPYGASLHVDNCEEPATCGECVRRLQSLMESLNAQAEPIL